jgi:orotate phosphoribosyltransferase
MDISFDALVPRLMEAGALRFGEFVTKSGRKSPYFVNMGAVCQGADLAFLAGCYAQAVKAWFGGVQNLFGPAYKGIPLAAAVASRLAQEGLDLSFTYNRKEAKDHGEGGSLVGDTYTAPRSVLIIEDVLTAGTAVGETMEILRGYPNARVAGVLVAVDRKERVEGTESALDLVRRKYGIEARALISIDDILLRAPAEHQAAIEAYRTAWGAAAPEPVRMI